MVSITREMKEKINELVGTDEWILEKQPEIQYEGEIFNVIFRENVLATIQVFQDRTIEIL